MRITTEDFTIDCTSAAKATLVGVLRLPSPTSYEEVLAGVRAGLDGAHETYVIDIRGVRFMNSSGITALSRLVLHARGLGKGLLILGSEGIPWQKKTIGSLKRLYTRLEVELA